MSKKHTRQTPSSGWYLVRLLQCTLEILNNQFMINQISYLEQNVLVEQPVTKKHHIHCGSAVTAFPRYSLNPKENHSSNKKRIINKVILFPIIKIRNELVNVKLVLYLQRRL